MFRREIANDSLSFVVNAFKRQGPSVGPSLGFEEVWVCVCVWRATLNFRSRERAKSGFVENRLSNWL